MKLQQLLNGIKVISVVGNLDREIDGIAYDSRQIKPNFVFVCYQGVAVDGHRFVSDAIEKGATAVISEKELSLPVDITWVRVENGRLALALMAANWYNVPAEKLRIIGITGTNGKTSTAYFTHAIFTAAGFKMGIMGSIAHKFGDNIVSATTTTPDALQLQRLLREMVDAGMDGVVMEVTSHSLAQERVAGIQFDAAVFTNLTQDHLDFHKEMQNYLNAKVKLFKQLKKGKVEDNNLILIAGGNARDGVAILNADDEASQYIIEKTIASQHQPCGAILTYGIDKPANISVKNINSTLSHLNFTIITDSPTASAVGGEIDVSLKLLGEYNLYNALAATGVALSAGIELDVIKTGLESTIVPGRFELVDCGQDFAVVVDYAHTPDALKRFLTAARKIIEGSPSRESKDSSSRLIRRKPLLLRRRLLFCIFGCGGDRDREKRPIMGKIASEIADYVIITSDNPRTEDPARIIAEIEAGMKSGKGFDTRAIQPKGYDVIVDRKAAIERGIELARPGDLVAIAGKGHEDYQDFGDKRIHFDDRVVAGEYIAKRLRA